MLPNWFWNSEKNSRNWNSPKYNQLMIWTGLETFYMWMTWSSLHVCHPNFKKWLMLVRTGQKEAAWEWTMTKQKSWCFTNPLFKRPLGNQLYSTSPLSVLLSRPPQTLHLKKSATFKFSSFTFELPLTTEAAKKKICQKINAAYETIATVARSLHSDSPQQTEAFTPAHVHFTEYGNPVFLALPPTTFAI